MSADNSLFLAAKEGDLELASRLLADGCDVTAMDESGWSAIMHAAFHSHVDVVHTILEATKLISDERKYYIRENKVRALQLAVFSGHLDVVNALVAEDEKAADEEVDWGPGSVIFEAFSHLTWFRSDFSWFLSSTANALAAGLGNMAMLEALRRPETSGYRPNKTMPLEFAAATGRMDIMVYLMEESGQSLGNCDDVLWAAIREDHQEAVDLLLERAKEYHPRHIFTFKYLASTAFFNCVISGNSFDDDRLSRMLLSIERITQTWPEGAVKGWHVRRDLLLLEALHSRHLGYVKAVLVAGADPNAELDRLGSEIYSHLLHPALEASRALQFGDPPTPTATPLYMAIYFDFPEVLNVLVDAGAHLDGRGDPKLGWSPLHSAAVLDKPAAVEQLC